MIKSINDLEPTEFNRRILSTPRIKRKQMIKSINDLEPTEFNRRYGTEILQKSLSNPINQSTQILDWILESDECVPFAITITFKNLVPLETSDGMKRAVEYQFENRVLNKIKKRLSRSSSKWNLVLPMDPFFQYEYEQGSFFKPVPKSNAPHHIHGVLFVKTELAPRIFNYDLQELDVRLKKDLYSLDTVSSFLIEPLIESESDDWMNYIRKGKSLSELTV